MSEEVRFNFRPHNGPLTELYAKWHEAKQAEKSAEAERRMIESQILDAISWEERFEGTKSWTDGPYKVKIVSRSNRKVDTDLLQELANEAGVSDHLPTLFRWKAEINKVIWEQTAPEITTPLVGAITTTPGKPSFAIEIGDK